MKLTVKKLKQLIKEELEEMSQSDMTKRNLP